MRKKIFKNILVSGIYTYLNVCINFLAMVVLARILSPSDYGIIAAIQVFSSFITIFQDNGIQQAVIKADSQDEKYLEKLHTLSMLIGILCTAAMMILAFPIALFYKNETILLPSIVLGINFFFNSLIIVPTASFYKELNFKIIGRIQVLSNILSLSICIVLAVKGFSYWSLVLKEASNIIIQFLIIFFIRKIEFHFNTDELKKYFLSIKSLLANITGFGIINFFSRNTDNLLVGKYYGEEKLGIYNRAYSLILLAINLIAGIFNQVLLPSLNKQSSEAICKEYYFITNLILFLLFPVMLLFSLIPEQITLLLLGNKWVNVTPFLPYVGILIFSQCPSNILGNVFLLSNKEKYLTRVALMNTFFTATGIIIGLFTSFLAVIKFYTLFYVFLSLPLTVYITYHIVLKNAINSFMKYWILKITVIWVVFFMINTPLQKSYLLWLILSLIFYLHLFINERKLIFRYMTNT